MLTAVLPELARWLPVTAAGSMCQTCQELLPVLDATRARIADTVARIVSLQGPLASALLQAGLSSAEVLAMRAQAWRWLDQCIQEMECRLMIALWTSRSNEAPHYRLEPPQPLARPAPSRR